MPYVRFHALNEEQVAIISKNLKYELAQALNTTEEAWEIEYISSTFYAKGLKTMSLPFVEVIWMARSQEVQDLCANLIAGNIKSSVGQDSFILFHNVAKQNFYKNGIHF